MRVLQTACDIGQLEVTSYAIQQILQHYTRKQLAVAVRSMEVSTLHNVSLADADVNCLEGAGAPSTPVSASPLTLPRVSSIVTCFTALCTLRANTMLLWLQTFSTTAADGMMEIDVSASSPDEPGSLYSMLDDTSQSIVKPFLTTKFIVTSRPSAAPGMNCHTLSYVINISETL